MIVFDAWHLPGIEDSDLAGWNEWTYDDGRIRIRVPVLDPSALGRVTERLRAAREEALAGRPVADVVRAVDAVARRLGRSDDPHRAQAERLLPAVTGYSPPMIRLILDRMAADWRAGALDGLLRAEFRDPGVLDGFRDDGSTAGPEWREGGPGRGGAAGRAGGGVSGGRPAPRRVRAYGPELAVHLFSGNVPGVAVTSLIRALLVKASSLGKTASGEPVLPVLFARMLMEVDPALGECLAVTYWPGGSAALEDVAFGSADTVIVYGGEESVASVRARIPPGTRLVEHGPRLSFIAIGKEALGAAEAPGVADAAARATAVFDQQGCVSPHVVYIERGGEVEPRRFAALLARGMERLEEELPRGRIGPAEAARIRQVRGGAEFRALAGRDVEVHASDGTEYTVIYEADPEFTASCLNRVIWVKPLDALEDVVAHVEPFARYLQTVGLVAGSRRREALAERLGRIGASRITDLQGMPWPPPPWHHDGRGPLLELIRWADLEG